MGTFLTPLQAYNAMFKLLDGYYEKTKSDDIGLLLGIMSFLIDDSTVDSAVWGDWVKAIDNKKILTKQDAFEGAIRFLGMYRGLALSDDIDKIIEKMSLAKNCNDITVPIVQQWNFHLEEALSEPESTREYLQFSEPRPGSLVRLQGFNAIYKLLDKYAKGSDDIARLAEGMLFLPDKGNVDPTVLDVWERAINNKVIITKQEAFEGAIRFLETYSKRFDSIDIAYLVKMLRSAQNCEDTSVPLVQQWSTCLNEALNEPGGAREYLKPVKK